MVILAQEKCPRCDAELVSFIDPVCLIHGHIEIPVVERHEIQQGELTMTRQPLLKAKLRELVGSQAVDHSVEDVNNYSKTRTKCVHCGESLAVVPGEARDMYQCQNWKCPRDHQPQGYIKHEKKTEG